MPTGLQITNSTGVLQIDETFRNLALRQKGTIAAATNLVISGLTSPILAFRPVTGNGTGFTKITDNGTGTFTWTASVRSSAANYWLFDVPLASAETVGLRVYDASSNLAFDSGQKYMKPVVGLTNFGGQNGILNNILSTGISEAASKTYAVVISSLGGWFGHPTPSSGTANFEVGNYLLLLNTTDSLFYASMVEEYNFPGGSSGWAGAVGQFIVLDVTGL